MRVFGVVAGVLCLAAGTVATAGAAVAPILGPGSYGQELVDGIKSAHGNVGSISIFANLKGNEGAVAVASVGGTVGGKPDGAVVAALGGGRANFTTDRARHVFSATLPLYDMQHKPAGALALTLNWRPGEGRDALEAEALAIRKALARRISYTENLVQEAHVDPNVPVRSYAQHLVDAALARHTDVLILAIHASTPKNVDPEILASNIGRIGKKADDDDMRVVRDGKTNVEVNKDLQRFEVELPLNDVSGVRIGALGVVFGLTADLDQSAKHEEAIRVRDEVSRRILSPANLVEPYPYDPKWTDNTLAQRLVDTTLAKNPDILVLALHVTPPAGTTNIILASNIGRIGKVADDDDMGVVNTGKPVTAPNAEGNRYEVELPLSDHAGKRVGAVSVVYAYRMGADARALAGKAEAVARALSLTIPSAAALFQPAR